MSKRLFLWLVACNAALIACGGGDDGNKPPGSLDPKCAIKSDGATPGFPFLVSDFETKVLPILQKSCGSAGCHLANATAVGQGGFSVWAAKTAAECDFAQSFNAVAAVVDTTTPANSSLTAAVTGAQPSHPFTFQETNPDLATIRLYISDAAARVAAIGGAPPPGGPSSPFDAVVFKTTIAPLFNRCETSGCHLAPSGQRAFNLEDTSKDTSQAAVDKNFTAITGRTNTKSPATSQIYVQATTLHSSGASKTMNPTESALLLDWITKAGAASPDDPTQGGCVPIAKFNVGTFRDEILPILNGEIDLNNGNKPFSGPSCTNGQCHGQQRGPGTLYMNKSDDAQTILGSFVCFVNLASPSRSEVLACPTDTAGCRKRPHPGTAIFQDGNDLNYQKILGFLYGANAEQSPFDFAFYVRKIEPIFNDVDSVENGARQQTCADVNVCHGSVSGQAPPNGSNFPIIPNATGLDRLTRNFVAATQMTNFLDATESSLFLYPTDEIADTDNHKFATGREHPGGLDFADNSAQAQVILQWAQGLRPDGQGFNLNWLVAGNFFSVNDLNGAQPEVPVAVPPSIFDSHAGDASFRLGGWDGFFSASKDVDLNIPFPSANTDRVAWAVSYALNTQSVPLNAQIEVTSDNQLEIYVDGSTFPVKKNAGVGTSAIAQLQLKAAGEVGASARIMIRILQRAADPTIKFSARFLDDQNIPLTDQTKELVFTLGNKGGL